MARPKTSGNGRLRKLECPTDGMIAYCSRGAVIRHGLPFCACGMQLFFADLEDMLAAVPHQAHEHPDFAAYTEREIRSAQREARKVPAGTLNCHTCGACHAPIRATNTVCGCGFHNDVRGNRNYGRWTAGHSAVSSACPF
jgi:hypothetical protein